MCLSQALHEPLTLTLYMIIYVCTLPFLPGNGSDTWSAGETPSTVVLRHPLHEVAALSTKRLPSSTRIAGLNGPAWKWPAVAATRVGQPDWASRAERGEPSWVDKETLRRGNRVHGCGRHSRIHQPLQRTSDLHQSMLGGLLHPKLGWSSASHLSFRRKGVLSAARLSERPGVRHQRGKWSRENRVRQTAHASGKRVITIVVILYLSPSGTRYSVLVFMLPLARIAIHLNLLADGKIV